MVPYPFHVKAVLRRPSPKISIVPRCYEPDMLDTLTLRDAGDGELPVFAQFWMAMFEEIGIVRESDLLEGWQARFLQYFRPRIARGEACLSVAVENGRVVGTAGALERDGYPAVVTGLRNGYIFGVRVEPQFRGRGIARALTERSIAFLRERGCRRIRLHASPAGRGIYEGLGFIATNEMELPSEI